MWFTNIRLNRRSKVQNLRFLFRPFPRQTHQLKSFISSRLDKSPVSFISRNFVPRNLINFSRNETKKNEKRWKRRKREKEKKKNSRWERERERERLSDVNKLVSKDVTEDDEDPVCQHLEANISMCLSFISRWESDYWTGFFNIFHIEYILHIFAQTTYNNISRNILRDVKQWNDLSRWK